MACVTSCCCECFVYQSFMDGDLKPRFLCRSFSPPLSCRWLGCHQKSDTPLQRSAVYKVCHGLPANCICRRYLLKQKGFYGVSYYIGFRDEFDVKVSSLCAHLASWSHQFHSQINDIIERICYIEERLYSKPEDAAPIIREIKLAAESSTHLYALHLFPRP